VAALLEEPEVRPDTEPADAGERTPAEESGSVVLCGW
jgi:hypothetical protein